MRPSRPKSHRPPAHHDAAFVEQTIAVVVAAAAAEVVVLVAVAGDVRVEAVDVSDVAAASESCSCRGRDAGPRAAEKARRGNRTVYSRCKMDLQQKGEGEIGR